MRAFIDFVGMPNSSAAHAGPLTVGAAAQTLAQLGVTIHADTRFVKVGVEDDEVRYTVQGTTPTATLGRKLSVDQTVTLSRAEADNLKLIRVTGDAKIQVMQYTE